MQEIPTEARVVIVGGGIVGCSLAYHLTKRGCGDVVLLERKQLTCGTTWHAAGLIGQLKSTETLTRLAQYTMELYRTLEAETGQATGFRRTGSLALASDAARLEELRRGAAMARALGIEAVELSPAEAGRLWPMMTTDDLVGAIHLPDDGQTSPVDTTQALARGARNGGARIFENTAVSDIVVANGRVTGVSTAAGKLHADIVVNCGGLWAREIGGWADAAVPLHAAEHFYVVTEPVPGLPPLLPTLRDAGLRTYFKEEAGKLLVGWFEQHAKPWGMAGIPKDFSFGQLPEDFAHIEPLLNDAIRRVPVFGEVGIKLFFNGPESFTPDDRYLLGETPEVRGLFVAAGFNSIGIQSAGGAGKVLADWILDGHPPTDLWDVDIRRMMPFQRNRRYLAARTTEALGVLYAMHWPHLQPETARGVRRSILHDRLAARGACFGEVAGYERANWFAPSGETPVYEYSFGRQNWFSHARAEHLAVRQAVGLFDQSSFAKFAVEGRDAAAALNHICANDIDVSPGRIVYTQWLNHRGGIVADLTVTRESDKRFLVITACAAQTHDFAWLRDHIPDDAHAIATDVSSAFAVLAVMGPKSRALLQTLTADDLSQDAFPFAASRIIDLGHARVRANRITYVGELGWELVIPSEFAPALFDTILEAGAPYGLRLAGYHAMDSLRMEKGYRHWGHDIGEDDTPIEAGLGFAVAWDKPGGFIGRDTLLRHQPTRRLLSFALHDNTKLLHHNEPIWRDGRRVGRITSGAYGHTIDRSLGLGYVTGDTSPGLFEIEIAGERVAADGQPKNLLKKAK